MDILLAASSPSLARAPRFFFLKRSEKNVGVPQHQALSIKKKKIKKYIINKFVFSEVQLEALHRNLHTLPSSRRSRMSFRLSLSTEARHDSLALSPSPLEPFSSILPSPITHTVFTDASPKASYYWLRASVSESIILDELFLSSVEQHCLVLDAKG